MSAKIWNHLKLLSFPSLSFCLILHNEPLPFIHSVGVLEERDGAKEDRRTSYSMKKKRKLCHLPLYVSNSLLSLWHVSSSSGRSAEIELFIFFSVNSLQVCFVNYMSCRLLKTVIFRQNWTRYTVSVLTAGPPGRPYLFYATCMCIQYTSKNAFVSLSM